MKAYFDTVIASGLTRGDLQPPAEIEALYVPLRMVRPSELTVILGF